MPTVATIVEYLETFAPRGLAAEWDNVGLLLGDRASAVERIMTCLTVTPESAAEAIAAHAELIVTHHPILFRPVQRLTRDTPEGRVLLDLIKAGVSVYSSHTAFDNTRGGINDQLAERLELVEVMPLRLATRDKECKIVVFVPDADLARVSDALFAAGAGRIGEYAECSFRLSGTGTFHGSEASNPTVGQKGRREEVSEWRLEVICPKERVMPVIAAMRKAHSYEEPAFDVYPLKPLPGKLGEGRVGRLAQKLTLAELAAKVKATLQAARVATVGEVGRPIERVALACGAGGEFIKDAVRSKADVLVTGEARFHDYLSAQAQGLALVLPGHYASERPGVEALAKRLQEQWPDLKVWASQRERDPLSWC